MIKSNLIFCLFPCFDLKTQEGESKESTSATIHAGTRSIKFLFHQLIDQGEQTVAMQSPKHGLIGPVLSAQTFILRNEERPSHFQFFCSGKKENPREFALGVQVLRSHIKPAIKSFFTLLSPERFLILQVVYCEVICSCLIQIT